MDPNETYPDVARAYAEGVRLLLAPPGSVGRERSGRSLVSPAEMAGRAGELALISAQLTVTAAGRLEHPDPAERAQAELQLLAKALTDLQVSAYLYNAAQQEESGKNLLSNTAVQRTGRAHAELQSQLDILTGAAPSITEEVQRSIKRLPLSLEEARKQLPAAAGDALDLIRMRTARTAQGCVTGLVGLGTAELTRALGLIGMDIASALGQAEKATQLYNLFREFLQNALASITALLGKDFLQQACQQAISWAGELGKAKLAGAMLEKLYQTAAAKESLGKLSASSQAGLESFQAAIQDLERLDEQHQKQVDMAGKLAGGLRLVGLIPVAALPQARLLMAGAYLLLTAYLLLSGADFVDAPALDWLDRIPGPGRIVESKLKGVLGQE
jgi:hypothetical protein